MHKAQEAFSLIEIMVVLAIIALLSTIALPNYFSYLAKAKQAEVALNLSSLHAAEQLYWAENGTYCAELTGPNGICWKPAGSKENKTLANYTYGFAPSGAREGIHYFMGKLGTDAAHLAGSFADKHRFLAYAAGKISSTKIDIWAIDEDRNLVHLQNGLE